MSNINDVKILKAKELFLAVLEKNCKNAEQSVLEEIALDLAVYISRNFSENFPKIVREKLQRLKENSDLSDALHTKKMSINSFFCLKDEEMKTEKQKEIERKIIEESTNASREAKIQAETTMFKCSKCKQNKCTYYQMQTRSCDEPMTTFVTCTTCGNCWKFC
ncbi:TFIIS [Ecytonucleospora hepatopenaei]|uniref:TFIIS n=1 Tax=Ecytonucleospora hepatopenaei TaxID=646526 RepID=A0A1W0E6Q8_9MICR|nr:TFIIS [Ecytonucleospora hepatopenaei]